MKFKKIIFVSVKDFNNNKAVDGYYPQDGHVINGFFHINRLSEFVAIGFEK